MYSRHSQDLEPDDSRSGRGSHDRTKDRDSTRQDKRDKRSPSPTEAKKPVNLSVEEVYFLFTTDIMITQ